MNVLVVTQYFWPENFRINDVVIGLKEEGHTVMVLTGKPNYPRGFFFEGYGFFKPTRELYEEIEVFRAPLIPRGSANGIRLVINYLSFALFGSIWGVWLLRKKKIDAILVYGASPITKAIPAIVLRRLKKAPLLYWVQDLWPESVLSAGNTNSKIVYKLANLITKFVYKNSDLLLAQSQGFIQALQKHNIPIDKIKYYPNYAEDIYSSITEHENIIHPPIPQGFIVMFAGNIGEAQGFDTIVQAARIVLEKNKKIFWVILGDGRKKISIQNQINEYGLNDNFLFLGSYPSNQMPYFFSQSDCLLISLKNDYIFSLTIPSKLQSYMAFGKPIVAALNGDAANIIKNSGCGLVADSEDAESLAKHILTLNTMPTGVLNEMGIKGKEYCKNNFDRASLLITLTELLKESKKIKI
jgi:glycosyltransferase involved in cell wall biosynthesis